MTYIKQPLLWSGRRYYIDELGNITTAAGEKISPVMKNNELYVDLEWVLGKRQYLVAVLVLYSFHSVKLPDYLIDEIVPLYKDNSPTNLSPGNLLYKFKSGKLPVADRPGFFYIPFHNGYAISEAGELINIETGRVKTWSVTKPDLESNSTGGYLYSRVLNDFGFTRTIFQHRALCYAFKPYGSDVEELVVNHLDGIPWNNHLDNLEWCTYERNNRHAVEIGLRTDNKPVLSKNLETGEIRRFSSIADCGRHYGQPRAGFVVNRLKNGVGKVYPDMLQFKYDDGSPWPEIDLAKVKITRVGRGNRIVAKNVFTGFTILFNGSTEGSEETGVSADNITSHCRENKLLPINGWNFRWYSDDIIWPEHTEKHLRIYSKFPINSPNGVVGIDEESGDELFFESVEIACRELKLSEPVLYYYFRRGKLYKGKYRLSLFKLTENLGLPVEKSTCQ